MPGLDVSDGVLLAIGAYVAVIALVRLMAAHRKKVTGELQHQIRAEQQRVKARGEQDKNTRDEAA